VSLLELLRFYPETYVRMAKSLFNLQVCVQIDRSSGDGKFAADTEMGLEVNLPLVKSLCEEIGLQVSAKHAQELIFKNEQGDIHEHDIEGLSDNIQRELSCRFYVGISEDRKEAFCKSLKGWETVLNKFPSATEDIEEMNKCYALCRYSASVFHSLLVMEHGLVALGKYISVTDPKEGWDASCRRLDSIVKAGRNSIAPGLDFEFLEQVNASIQAIKQAWRNKVNHATGKPIVMHGGFAPYVSEETIAATRSFMRRLAEGLP
jgi:hypothetical protein